MSAPDPSPAGRSVLLVEVLRELVGVLAEGDGEALERINDVASQAEAERDAQKSDDEVPTARPTHLPLERAVRKVDELLCQVLVSRGLVPAPGEASAKGGERK